MLLLNLDESGPLEGFGEFPLQPSGKILIVLKITQCIASVGYLLPEEKIHLKVLRGEEKKSDESKTKKKHSFSLQW